MNASRETMSTDIDVENLPPMTGWYCSDPCSVD